MEKKGITPVIAVVLLILMTISISALTFSWLKNLFTEQKEAVQAQQEAFKVTLFDIQRAWFDSSNQNLLHVYIYNSGQTDIDLSKAVYTFESYDKISGNLVNSATLNGNDLNITVRIKPGSYHVVDINTTTTSFFNSSALSNYDLKITILYKDSSASYTIS